MEHIDDPHKHSYYWVPITAKGAEWDGREMHPTYLEHSPDRSDYLQCECGETYRVYRDNNRENIIPIKLNEQSKEYIMVMELLRTLD